MNKQQTNVLDYQYIINNLATQFVEAGKDVKDINAIRDLIKHGDFSLLEIIYCIRRELKNNYQRRTE